MVKIPFAFKFQDRHYSGLFKKEQPVGTEVNRFEVSDIDPPDFPVPEPFYIAGNYDDDAYSFPGSAGENIDFLRAIANAVIGECAMQGDDRC